MVHRELNAQEAYHQCDTDQFTFETTARLEPAAEIFGQPRAEAAVALGMDIRRQGYNIFALGPPGAGKRALISQCLEKRAPQEETPDDWCYINNLEDPNKPTTLRLPAGRGRQLRDDMVRFTAELSSALGAIFHSEAYREQADALRRAAQEHNAVDAVRQHAREKGLDLVQSPAGIGLAPIDKNGKPLTRADLEALPAAEQARLQASALALQEETRTALQQAENVDQRLQQQLRSLSWAAASHTLEPLLARMRRRYRDLPPVLCFFEAIKKDLLAHGESLLRQHREDRKQHDQQAAPIKALAHRGLSESALERRYRINLLVSHEPTAGAPVVFEDQPTFQRLLGRVEHLPHRGTLLSDFNLIKAGTLHRANGGYLVIDAHRMLLHPGAWEALKGALSARQIRIESLPQAVGLMSTVSLEPTPIPLDVKVVLLGTAQLYNALCEADPDFAVLFKVAADFDTEIDRNPTACQRYAGLIKRLGLRHGLRPFNRAAVARLIEQSSRIAGDGRKLSLHRRWIEDLLTESDYWAGQRDSRVVHAADVQHAVDAQVHRADRLRARTQELIQQGTILIDTAGSRIGQVNGLSVQSHGEFLFGRPNRITAQTRIGTGKVIDIEREVALGGPSHSKGILILSGLLAGRYAHDVPLSLSASLVIEQSYGGIDGDSASSAELYALLSAIAQAPIKQSLAVTGSVNQYGEVQAIGGVNAKIEGFYDLCAARQLSGQQGVIIPAANVENLMLRRDVVEAIAAGAFHIYAVETIDEGIELLTDQPAGEADAHGLYPIETINGRVQARLAELAHWRTGGPPVQPTVSLNNEVGVTMSSPASR